MRYADPRLCPDCRTTLPASPGPVPRATCRCRARSRVELFQTLQHADVLLDRLRAKVTAEKTRASTRTRAQGPTATPVRRTGLRTASVPAILLGLGALCLLVAAITFLAVAWSWMGVGGRTGVLVGLTVAAAGAGVVLGRRGLRVAAESLTTVALGLVALDVVGAINAGWLGSPDSAASTALVGAGVAVVSGAILVAAVPSGRTPAGGGGRPHARLRRGRGHHGPRPPRRLRRGARTRHGRVARPRWSVPARCS